MDNKQIGKFISDERKKMNLTQKELAEALLVTDKSVSKWECGLCYPDITLLPKLCELLNITIIELFNCKKIETTNITNEMANGIVKVSLDYSKDIMEENKKHYKKIFLIFLGFLFIALLIFSFIFDYNRYLKYQDPVFSFYSSKKYYGEDKVTEYYGLGYKIIKYESETGKNIYEFTNYFKKIENITLDKQIVKEIEIELLNNSKISKNDSKCFAKAKVLSTTKFDAQIEAYVWLTAKCYLVNENKLIEESTISLPYKVSLTSKNNTYIIDNYSFPRDNDYINEINKLFPKNVKILINNFYNSEHSKFINQDIKNQVNEYFKEYDF